MPLNCQVLFDTPQHEIASLIRHYLDRCNSAFFVSGFATVDGIESISAPIRADPSKLEALVIGAGTYRAFEALDNLIATGVSADHLFVHLGHTRLTRPDAVHAFYRYHPMLHSKVYLMEMPDGTASAFVGSHNLTNFALNGLNGEASVLLDGPTDDPELIAVRRHVEGCRAEAVTYSPAMKEALSWWTLQSVEALRTKADKDRPHESEAKRTIVIMAAQAERNLPSKDDIVYFEIPATLGQIQSLRAEVHMFVFRNLPPTPQEALTRLDEAEASYWCRTEGLEIGQGGVELRTDWHMDDGASPKLLRAPRPFRPTPSPGMQQVRVKVWNEVFGKYEYLFDVEKPTWEPILDETSEIQAPLADRELLRALDLAPNPEDKEWYRVKDLRPAEPSGSEDYKNALKEVSPESGSFILMSLRRRRIGG